MRSSELYTNAAQNLENVKAKGITNSAIFAAMSIGNLCCVPPQDRSWTDIQFLRLGNTEKMEFNLEPLESR